MIEWDDWRRRYRSMTFLDQREFYARVAVAHPCQQHFDLEAARRAFSSIGSDVIVTELGGWDGALASRLLPEFEIREWTNYDLVDVAQACDRSNYYRVLLTAPFWQLPVYGDVFLATHTIEHITGDELALLVGALRVEWVYLEAPLAEEPTDWTGYGGTHILELGWSGVEELLAGHGFERLWIERDGRLWRRA